LEIGDCYFGKDVGNDEESFLVKGPELLKVESVACMISELGHLIFAQFRGNKNRVLILNVSKHSDIRE